MSLGLRPTFLPRGILTIQPFGYNRRGLKIGRLRPLFGEWSWVPIQHNVARAEAYLHAKFHLDPCSHLATTDMGRKLGAPPPFGVGGAGSSSNTIWPGPWRTCLTTFILIHATVWPQYINVSDRQDRRDRQQSDSIGRTVLQTVAQETRVRVKMRKMIKVKLLSSFREITFFIANIVRTKHHTAMSHLRFFAIFATPTNI